MGAVLCAITKSVIKYYLLLFFTILSWTPSRCNTKQLNSKQ